MYVCKFLCKYVCMKVRMYIYIYGHVSISNMTLTNYRFTNLIKTLDTVGEGWMCVWGVEGLGKGGQTISKCILM